MENYESDVREITGAALTSQAECVRWDILTELRGIGPSNASAVLHLFHEGRYPMNTSYARGAFYGLENENELSFDFWMRYVTHCRTIADRNKVCMRTLDRAKWMYSEAHSLA